MDIVFSQDPRDFARRDWSALVRADPAGTFFHTPGFLKIYWEEFADQPDHLLLAFADEDGEQVGAVAFERLDGTLRFLGGTEVTDYMGPVALPEARSTVAKELFAALGRADDWAEADLRGLPEDQPWLELLVSRDNDVNTAILQARRLDRTPSRQGRGGGCSTPPAGWETLPAGKFAARVPTHEPGPLALI